MAKAVGAQLRLAAPPRELSTVAVLHYPCCMDDVLYQAPRGGKLHFSHCRLLKHLGSDFRSWDQVSAASIAPTNPRLCKWCREDLRKHRAELERTSGSPESLSAARSAEDYLLLGRQAVDLSHQAIDLAQRVGPPAKRAMLATANAAAQARLRLSERRAARKLRRAERRQRELKPADPPTSTHDAEAEAEEITDAGVIDAEEGPSEQPPSGGS